MRRTRCFFKPNLQMLFSLMKLRLEICLLVIIAARVHPVTSRTRKLSSHTPMVLGGEPPGRVGHCQETFHLTSLFTRGLQTTSGFFPYSNDRTPTVIMPLFITYLSNKPLKVFHSNKSRLKDPGTKGKTSLLTSSQSRVCSFAKTCAFQLFLFIGSLCQSL